MAILYICKNCETRSWNRDTDTSAMEVTKSFLVLKNGKYCPVCGNQVGDFAEDVVDPQPKKIVEVKFNENNIAKKENKYFNFLKLRNYFSSKVRQKDFSTTEPMLKSVSMYIDLLQLVLMKNPNYKPNAFYDFPYHVLRYFCFTYPEQVANLLQYDYSNFIINGLLEIANKKSLLKLDINEITIKGYTINSNPCILICLPIPKRSPEPYFVAIYSVGNNGQNITGKDIFLFESFHYFSLEASSDNYTMIGETFNTKNRLNHGSGPNPKDGLEFLRVVNRIVDVNRII